MQAGNRWCEPTDSYILHFTGCGPLGNSGNLLRWIVASQMASFPFIHFTWIAQAPTGCSMLQRSVGTVGGGVGSMPQRPFRPLSSYFLLDGWVVTHGKAHTGRTMKGAERTRPGRRARQGPDPTLPDSHCHSVPCVLSPEGLCQFPKATETAEGWPHRETSAAGPLMPGKRQSQQIIEQKGSRAGPHDGGSRGPCLIKAPYRGGGNLARG